jgi:hypothetical protein
MMRELEQKDMCFYLNHKSINSVSVFLVFSSTVKSNKFNGFIGFVISLNNSSNNNCST